jgi:hypothetical protein
MAILSSGLVSQQSNGHGSGISDKTASSVEKLEKLEQSQIAREIRAVDNALLLVGLDMAKESDAINIRKAIKLNCEDRKGHPYQYLNVIGVSKSDFYRRKEKFLCDVLAFL